MKEIVNYIKESKKFNTLFQVNKIYKKSLKGINFIELVKTLIKNKVIDKPESPYISPMTFIHDRVKIFISSTDADMDMGNPNISLKDNYKTLVPTEIPDEIIKLLNKSSKEKLKLILRINVQNFVDKVNRICDELNIEYDNAEDMFTIENQSQLEKLIIELEKLK